MIINTSTHRVWVMLASPERRSFRDIEEASRWLRSVTLPIQDYLDALLAHWARGLPRIRRAHRHHRPRLRLMYCAKILWSIVTMLRSYAVRIIMPPCVFPLPGMIDWRCMPDAAWAISRNYHRLRRLAIWASVSARFYAPSLGQGLDFKMEASFHHRDDALFGGLSPDP